MKKIYIAGGCFWGVAEYYRRLLGVVSTVAGYGQGIVENPTYQQVCTSQTEHAEIVEVQYDESVLGLSKIVEHFMRIVDPTSLNRQGNDMGTQYRVGLYSEDEQDLSLIRLLMLEYQKQYRKPIVVEVQLLRNFYKAEEYHQDYLVKNKNGYCHVNFDLIKPHELK